MRAAGGPGSLGTLGVVGVFTSEQGLRVGKAQAAWGFASDHRPGLNARVGSCSEARPQGCYRAPPSAVCTQGGPWRGAQHPEPTRHNSPDPVRGCHRNCSFSQDPQAPDRKPSQPQFRPYPSSADTSHSLLPRSLGVKARKPS